MAWETFKLKEDEKKFIVRGGGYLLHGEVWQGAMRGDAFWGLKALSLPSCRERVLRPWKISAPKRVGAEDNTGQGRRFLRFTTAVGAPFVLRFEEYVPKELIDALRVAFSGKQGAQKGENDEEPAGEAQQHPA